MPSYRHTGSCRSHTWQERPGPCLRAEKQGNHVWPVSLKTTLQRHEPLTSQSCKRFMKNKEMKEKWRKCFEDNTTARMENVGPRRGRLPFFLLVPKLSLSLYVCLFFSLLENMERSLSCDKAVACEMGTRDPSSRGVGLPCQSAPLRAVMHTCSIHTSFTKPFCAQATEVWPHPPQILQKSSYA